MKNLTQILNLILNNPSARQTMIDISVDSVNGLSNMYNSYLDDVAWNIAYNRYMTEKQQEE